MSILEKDKDLRVIIDPPVHKFETTRKKTKAKETFVTKLIIEPYNYETKTQKKAKTQFVCIGCEALNVQTRASAENILHGNETVKPEYLLLTWPKPEDHCCVPSISYSSAKQFTARLYEKVKENPLL